MADRRIHELARALYHGKIDRRDFMRAAAALGVSSAAVECFLRGSFAQSGAGAATPVATPVAEATRPPIVAQPCAGDSCRWTGKAITIQAANDPIAATLEEVRAEFEAATGARLAIVADAPGRAFTRLLDDATSGTNAYDGSIIAMDWLGELAEGGFVLPVDGFAADGAGKFPTYDADSEPASLRQLRVYGGERFVVPYEGDGHILYFRRDLLNDPKHRTAFKAAIGYDMPTPPQTWDQFRDIAKYFDGKDNGLGGAIRGVSLPFRVGGQGMHHFASLSAPYVIGPDNPNLYWFDPDDMQPLCVSQGHVRAATILHELFQLGPKEMAGWTLDEAWDEFLKGNAVFTWSGGGVMPLALARKAPTSGKLGAAPLPGAMSYVNPKTGAETKVTSPNIVGNTTGYSWSGIVMRSAPVPELAYYLFALLATEPKQRFFAARLVDGIDPARTYQIPKPLGDGSIDDYTAQGWDAQDALDYTAAFFHTFGNELQLPYLRIPGSERYWSALDVRISELMTGEAATAEAALKNVADDWNAITDELDRETQLQSYLTSLGLPVAPPSD